MAPVTTPQAVIYVATNNKLIRAEIRELTLQHRKQLSTLQLKTIAIDEDGKYVTTPQAVIYVATELQLPSIQRVKPDVTTPQAVIYVATQCRVPLRRGCRWLQHRKQLSTLQLISTENFIAKFRKGYNTASSYLRCNYNCQRYIIHW